mgnify:CR=1 FL=1
MADRKTVTFDEGNKGWTSFHSYTPEWMTRLGTKFYTFSGGELYEHDATSVRGRFYGSSDPCDLTFNVNQEPSTNKIFKNISLETNSTEWDLTITTNMESGEIEKEMFIDKEGFKYGYIRQLGSRLDFNELRIIGIGNLQEIIDDASPTETEFRFSEDVPTSIGGSQNDYLYFNSGQTRLVGIVNDVTAHPDYGNTRDVIHIVETQNEENIPQTFFPSVGNYMFVARDPSPESRGIRGYFAQVRIENDSRGGVELFSVGTESVQSFM